MGLGQKMNCVAFLGNTFLNWTQARGPFRNKIKKINPGLANKDYKFGL